MTKDSQLQEAVLATFNWEPSLSGGHIGVAANAGIVSLTGYVDSYAEKRAAEKAALRVRGVRGVAEEIEVRLAMDARRSDAEIAAAVVERLSWNVTVPKDSVQVKVETGWVTLTGQVDWWYQKQAAMDDIKPLHGVLGVSNQIAIKPQVDTSGLSDDITHALHRSWLFDPLDIRVEATGGRVSLTGTVKSWHERQVAGEMAWSARGTTAVENDIFVV